jgi:hypothetical protein
MMGFAGGASANWQMISARLGRAPQHAQQRAVTMILNQLKTAEISINRSHFAVRRIAIRP